MRGLTFFLTTLLLASLSPAARGEQRCQGCVEDVVVETADGRWLSGYIHWDEHPFRYLDLSQASARLALARGGGSPESLDLWVHAVAISRHHLPPELGTPPPAPVPSSPAARPINEVALLVGEPEKIALASLRRIYPRIGSGLPGFRISRQQLTQLAANNLPFDDRRSGECMGCPMTVEDATIILASGELVSGLLAWHAATTTLEGYDFRNGARPRIHAYDEVGWHEDVVLWQDAVSGPRRRFESAASTGSRGELVAQRGFLRVLSSVLLVGAARVFPVAEIAFVLPGPSKSTYPLLIDRQSARRLLLQQPSLAMTSHRASIYTYCLSYVQDATLEALAEVCGEAVREDGKLAPSASAPTVLHVRTPGSSRQPPELAHAADFITLYFDEGT